TLSKESIWGRLISKLKLNETENIRQSLYNVWRRHRPKIEDEICEKRVDSVEEDNKTDKRNKVELSLSNPESQSTASDAYLPHREARSTVKHQSNAPTIVEASFILTLKQWKDLYNSFTRNMEPGWTNVIYEKVRSCNF
ncbi:unnamed protein product, partial [Didymodactylos carnosus]